MTIVGKCKPMETIRKLQSSETKATLDTRNRTKTNGTPHKIHNVKEKKIDKQTPPRHLVVQQPMCSFYSILVVLLI